MVANGAGCRAWRGERQLVISGNALDEPAIETVGCGRPRGRM